MVRFDGAGMMDNNMVVVETMLPKDIFNALQANGVFKSDLAKETRYLLALRFYRDRVLSLGRAARLAGLSRWDFVEYLSVNKIPVFDYSQEELAQEFDAVNDLDLELDK